ncbi:MULTISPECIES: signal peptidase I [unclassified Adlercreutzia]|uniref:signal peptidase I n=1 Tax=unclassified Adlercreutzia TaxID=2636013 RepID=UPI00197E33E3|nr:MULTISPECIES: signal peptidase I [unclassified Adlercreutzia]
MSDDGQAVTPAEITCQAVFVNTESVKAELERERSRQTKRRITTSTILGLVVVAAVAVLAAVLMLPTLVISGSSMTDTLEDGDVVMTLGVSDLQQGDVVAFYHNNNVLVKRVIAGPGDWVDIDKDGNVSVNGEELDESYVTDKALGTCDIRLPFQVPDGKHFVMGDHRQTSVDSRSSQIGCVSPDDMVGKLALRVWPLNRFGPVN